jgi:hypothetical protein
MEICHHVSSMRLISWWVSSLWIHLWSRYSQITWNPTPENPR